MSVDVKVISARYRTRCGGVSLLEAMIALLILWIAVLAISYTVTAGHQHMQHTEVAMRALQLAEDLMQEIISKQYAEPGVSVLGTDLGETQRSHYDDLDDYHGYSEALSSLKDVNGDDYDGTDDGLRRQVNVVATNHAVPGLGAIPGKRITVSVYDTSNAVWQVVRFVSEPVP